MNIVISNDIIKGALISYLKTLTLVTTELYSASEIRENEWKGTEFNYPNIRVRLIRNAPIDGECSASDILISIEIFTEAQSSATADEISGIIAQYLHNQQFSYAFQGSSYHFSFGVANLVPAQSIGAGDMAWRSEVVVDGMISKI